VIPAEEKTANIKIFKKEVAFLSISGPFSEQKRLCLLITSPLKKGDQDVVTVSSSPVKKERLKMKERQAEKVFSERKQKESE